MPIVQIHLMEGRSKEQKRALAANVTKAICDTLGAEPQRVRVILSDMAPGDYAIGGVLIADQEQK